MTTDDLKKELTEGLRPLQLQIGIFEDEHGLFVLGDDGEPIYMDGGF